MESPSVTENSEQDSSFLIIDESVNAESIPDTAVQLFDAPSEENTAIVSEMSFSTEPEVPEVVVSEISFDSSREMGVSPEPVVSTEASTEPEMAEPIVNIETLTFGEAEIPAEEVIAASVPEKNDIYAPVKNAIAEYDAILESHTKIAEAKDAEISDYNDQVATAKAAAKKALEERKNLETEMDKVRQMKELFSAQLK